MDSRQVWPTRAPESLAASPAGWFTGFHRGDSDVPYPGLPSPSFRPSFSPLLFCGHRPELERILRAHWLDCCCQSESLMSRIPFLAICCITLFVVLGEKLCGTDTYFAAAVGVIFVVIGVTYNLLGGLKTISGILFAEFALRTIVISQFLKIFFREPADLNLEAAHLTITLYLIFYCCLALASVFFGRLKLPLPRPIEARTQAQTHIIYWIALVAGSIGMLMFDIQALNPVGKQSLTLSHSVGLALSNLLFLALVLAIDERIRTSAGRHSLGWAAMIPVAVMWTSALVTTSRQSILGTVVLYGLVCYFRNYRFRKRHLLCAISFGLFFIFVFSPFELY